MKKVFGVGINDANYVVKPVINGVKTVCPYYARWVAMLNRCYNTNAEMANTFYKDCTVCTEWHTFSNFRSWMESQDWLGKDLDKDLLSTGQKIYSPLTCMFVPKVVNCFFNRFRCNQTGASQIKKTGNWTSHCRDPFTGKKIYLGVFPEKRQALSAYNEYKMKLAIDLASQQADPRISTAIMGMINSS